MRTRAFVVFAIAASGACPAVVTATSTGLINERSTPTVTVAREVKRDTSRPMRDILVEIGTTPPGAELEGGRIKVIPNILPGISELYGEIAPSPPEARAQTTPTGVPAPATIASFDGLRIGLGGGGVPPDTTGDVSPAHFFQWVNTSWALFDKTSGSRVSGPNPGNSFFAGFGGLCQTTNQGDPLVLWDDAAQRWVVSQFAFTGLTTAPFLQCIAVSTTADPLGSYHRYAFNFPIFNDYGKLGVWRTEDGSQNAYLMSMHEFVSATQFGGTSFSAVERDAMLNGQSARFIRVGGIQVFGAIPFHLEGTAAMPTGACPMFVHFDGSGSGYRLWDFCINWVAGTASFNPTPEVLAGPAFGTGPINGVPQRDSTIRLDDFQSNTMYLAPVRAFGGNGPREAIGAMFHTVNADGTRAGARWVRFGFSQVPVTTIPGPGDIFADSFESGLPAGPNRLAKRIVEAGTYAPGTEFRWMGSVNIDRNGNLGLGYTASSSTINPDIRINGKLRNETPGQLRDEQLCTVGNTGAQTGGAQVLDRWGDYSTTAIDPSDDCTFWHTNEYFSTTSGTSWNTRICSFRFPECGNGEIIVEPPTARVPVCSTASLDPSAAVRVAMLGSLTGSATLSASAFPAGMTPAFNPNPVALGQTTQLTLNGARARPPGDYSGTVTATSGPVSGSANVLFGVSAANPAAPALQSPINAATAVAIRPLLRWGAVTGALSYKIELASDAAFASIIEAGTSLGTEYRSRQLLGQNQTFYWRVTANNYCGAGSPSAGFSFTTGAPGTCPGASTIAFEDDVSGDAIPWATQNISGDIAAMWAKTVPPAGTGLATRAWVAGNSATTADQILTTPPIALPNLSGLTLAFDAHHQYEVDGTTDCWDGGHVEISVGAGAFVPLGNERTLADPYPGVLSSGNPAAGLSAWCRQPTPGTPIRTTFSLDEFAGQSVRVRFRSTADSNTVGPAPAGWSIDNIVVKGCQ